MDDNYLASKRLNHLDLYKGICILFVITTHYSWKDIQRQYLLFPFWIEMAVPVFMVITGYLSAMSLDKSNISVREAYHPKNVACKWLRFVIPFIPVFALQIIVECLETKSINLVGQIWTFVSGGIGPGSYYFPVMIQVVLIFPLIWGLVKKHHFRGLVVCFGINLIYEVVKTYINMRPGIYRLCAFRYIFILAYGCFLFYVQEKESTEKKYGYYIAGIFGAVYIVLFNYTGTKPIITNQWTVTSVFAVLFIVPIMRYLIKPNKLHNWLLELVGRASFNIFLVQMIYYWLFAEKVYEVIRGTLFSVLINMGICCLLGIFYHKIENPITQKVMKIIKNL